MSELTIYSYVDGDPISFIDPEGLAAEHTSGARPSTKGKHEAGQSRKGRDAGGEDGDKRRRPGGSRPDKWKGPWPPKPQGGAVLPELGAFCLRVGAGIGLLLTPSPLACGELPENCKAKGFPE